MIHILLVSREGADALGKSNFANMKRLNYKDNLELKILKQESEHSLAVSSLDVLIKGLGMKLC